MAVDRGDFALDPIKGKEGFALTNEAPDKKRCSFDSIQKSNISDARLHDFDSGGRRIGRIAPNEYSMRLGGRVGRIDRVFVFVFVFDSDRVVDAAGRKIGRADGLRRRQIITFFFLVT